jgi:predicted alpha/beta superfamily hydrolase
VNDVQTGASLARFHRGPRLPGSVHTIERVYAPELGNARDIHVYLPPGYDANLARYPVVYLHDGQNLFDPALAFASSWRADAAADAAARLGYECILVGISNVGSARIDEYSPFADLRVGGGRGEHYLAFVVRRIKPLIDSQYRTLPDREHTSVGGASLGGLISLFAFFRYPEVFGRAIVQSPALWFAHGAMLDYVRAAAHVPGRIWLDVGRREGKQTLRNARALRRQLVASGYEDGHTLRWIEDRTGAHDEVAWGRRLKRALPFVLEERAA